MGRLANGPRGWIGVDLDRTLAQRGHDGGANEPGEPILPMVARVKKWLAEGRNVRIFTARVAECEDNPKDWTPPSEQRALIEAWCLKHIGTKLPVTCVKDYFMLEMWDDVAVAVEENTGTQLSSSKVEGPPPMQFSEPWNGKFYQDFKLLPQNGLTACPQGLTLSTLVKYPSSPFPGPTHQTVPESSPSSETEK